MHRQSKCVILYHFLLALGVNVDIFVWDFDSFQLSNLVNIRNLTQLGGQGHEVLLLVRTDLLACS